MAPQTVTLLAGSQSPNLAISQPVTDVEVSRRNAAVLSPYVLYVQTQVTNALSPRQQPQAQPRHIIFERELTGSPVI